MTDRLILDALHSSMEDPDIIHRVRFATRSRLPCHPLHKSGESTSWTVVVVVAPLALRMPGYFAAPVHAAIAATRVALDLPTADKPDGVSFDIVKR